MKKSSIYSLYFTYFNDLLGWAVVITIFPPMILDRSHGILSYGLGYTERTIILGFLLASFAFVQFFSSPIIGALADHYGRKKILIVAVLGALVSFILSGAAIMIDSIYLLFFSRMLTGATSATLSICQAAVMDLSPQHMKAKNMSHLAVLGGISWIIGPIIGGKLADANWVSWFNYSTPMWFTAILFFLNFFCLMALFQETYVKKETFIGGATQEIRNLKKFLKIPSMRSTLVSLLLFLVGWFFFLLFYPAMLVKKFDFNVSQIGDITGYMAFWWIMGSLVLTKWLTKKMHIRHLIFLPCLISGFAIVTTLIPLHPFYLWLIFPFSTLPASLAWIHISTLLSMLTNKEDQGKVFGISSSLQSFALFIAPLISGFLAAGNAVYPLAIGGIFVFLTGFYYQFFFNQPYGTKVT